MRPYIAREVSSETWKLFHQMRDVFLRLPDSFVVPCFFDGEMIPLEIAEATLHPNCHMLTRAFAKVFPVRVHDGYLAQTRVDGQTVHLHHSWLTPRSESASIIDLQPLGVVTGPILLLKKYSLEYGPECSFLLRQEVEFRTYVAIISREVKKIANR